MPSTTIPQAPVRNASLVGAQVNTHSVEYAPRVTDLALGARGGSFEFVRAYRSVKSDVIGPLGRGWTFCYAKRLELSGDDVLYHDGFGRVHRFQPNGSSAGFASPDGLYARLEEARDSLVLRHRGGGVM